MKRTLCSLLVVCLLICCGCKPTDIAPEAPSASEAQTEPSEQSIPNAPLDTSVISRHNDELIDFSIALLRQAHDGQNTVLSPVSVLYSLAMAANGAEGQTLEQIEKTLGVNRQELSDWLTVYRNILDRDDKTTIHLANSIWYADHPQHQINEAYLRHNAALFGAEAFPAHFDDSTVKSINDWVSQKTDGMIPKIVDRLPEDSAAFLVNTLAFSASWDSSFKEAFDGIFIKENGDQASVRMMERHESNYIKNQNTTGFMKLYQDGQYAFVALLPKEGVRMEDYLKSLDGAGLTDLLSAVKEEHIHIVMPKFKGEFSKDLSETLQQIGIQNAFEPLAADFGEMFTNDTVSPHISQVLHRTVFEVDEKGTCAAAATGTSLEWYAGSRTSVFLERPFVYMIVDTETFTPLFMGVMMDPSNG